MARGEVHDVVVATHWVIGHVLAIAVVVAEGRQVWRARCYGPEKIILSCYFLILYYAIFFFYFFILQAIVSFLLINGFISFPFGVLGVMDPKK